MGGLPSNDIESILAKLEEIRKELKGLDTKSIKVGEPTYSVHSMSTPNNNMSSGNVFVLHTRQSKSQAMQRVKQYNFYYEGKPSPWTYFFKEED